MKNKVTKFTNILLVIFTIVFIIFAPMLNYLKNNSSNITLLNNKVFIITLLVLGCVLALTGLMLILIVICYIRNPLSTKQNFRFKKKQVIAGSIIIGIIAIIVFGNFNHKQNSQADKNTTSQVATQNDNNSTSTDQDNDSTSQIGTQTDNNSTQQDDDSTSKLDNSATTNTSKDFKEGEEVTLSSDASVCSSRDNVDKMINYVQNKNEQAIENMENKGEAKVIPKGSNITIVKLGIVVEIEDSNGQDWYAPYEVFK